MKKQFIFVFIILNLNLKTIIMLQLFILPQKHNFYEENVKM